MRDLDTIDAAVLAVLATADACRVLLVALVALVLTLAGYRPAGVTRASASRLAARPVPAYVAPNVVQLRAQVRALRGPAFRPGGRRIAQARRADLLAAMAWEVAA